MPALDQAQVERAEIAGFGDAEEPHVGLSRRAAAQIVLNLDQPERFLIQIGVLNRNTMRRELALLR